MNRNEASRLYLEHRDRLDRLVVTFYRRFGGDREEARSEADLAFARACLDFDAGRGMDFARWFRSRVWSRLRRWRLVEALHAHDQLDSPPAPKKHALLAKFWEEASPGALVVLQALLDQARSTRGGAAQPHRRLAAAIKELTDSGRSHGMVRDALNELELIASD